MEWGCGCGRILRNVPPPVAPKRLYGNDIDRDALAWVDENLPWVETSRTDGMPPLPYADNSFDLIFNHSVMTHLDEDYQDAWLAELHRVVRPGGIVTLTVSGQHAFQMFLDTLPPDSAARAIHVEKLREQGIDFIDQDNWASEFPDFYHTTFHSAEYIFRHWSTILDIRAYIPRGSLDYQDMIVLQKRAGDAATSLARQDCVVIEDRNKADELAIANAELQAQLQRVYASRSWLLTKPWRYIGGLVKKRLQT
jgi:SAM-dependent methyltransferase